MGGGHRGRAGVKPFDAQMVGNPRHWWHPAGRWMVGGGGTSPWCPRQSRLSSVPGLDEDLCKVPYGFNLLEGGPLLWVNRF